MKCNEVKWIKETKKKKMKKKIKPPTANLLDDIGDMQREDSKSQEPLKISYVIRYHTSKLLAFFFS